MSSSGTSGYAQKRKPKNPIKFQISLNEEQKQAKQTILDNKITLIGEKKFKMTDFKIDPPKALFGTITTGDDITIKFSTTFK